MIGIFWEFNLTHSVHMYLLSRLHCLVIHTFYVFVKLYKYNLLSQYYIHVFFVQQHTPVAPTVNCCCCPAVFVVVVEQLTPLLSSS